MDFVVGLTRTLERYDAIWVFIDRFMNSARFVPIKATYSVECLAEIYIINVVQLYKVLLFIILDRNAHFTSYF